MFLHETGSASQPTIVFLHGNGSNGSMWKAHMERFTNYHCLAPDFPGFGRSNGQEWDSLDAVAAQVAEIIRTRAAGGRAHIVGLSLGSSVAFALLGQAPERVDHAIIDGAGVLPLPGLGLMKVGFRLMQPLFKTEPFIKMIAQSTKIAEEDYPEFRANMRAMSARSFTRAFVQALSLRQPAGLERVTCPTLFVAGEKEPEPVRRSGRMLAEIMPHAASRIAPGMGHGWLAEAADLHYRMIRAWLHDEPLPNELIS